MTLQQFADKLGLSNVFRNKDLVDSEVKMPYDEIATVDGVLQKTITLNSGIKVAVSDIVVMDLARLKEHYGITSKDEILEAYLKSWDIKHGEDVLLERMYEIENVIKNTKEVDDILDDFGF